MRRLRAAIRSILSPCALLALAAAERAGAQELFRLPIAEQPGTSMAVGAAARFGTGIYRDDDGYADALPLFLIESRWLFAHGNTAGLHLFRDSRFRLDLLARYRFDRFEPDPQAAGQARLRERRQTVDAGVAAEYRADWGLLRGVWVTDTQSRHEGQELELSYGRSFALGDWVLMPYLSLIWQDRELTDYYYGVDPAEAAPGTPAYESDDALNATFGLNSRYMLTGRWFLQANVALTRYDSAISDSPIVDDSLDARAFIGTGYLFDGPHRKREGLGPGQGLWTYRVNYGYTAEANIFPLLMAGWWEASTEADTNLLGITVGRLLRPGKRADVYARFAAYRHLEKDLQDDTWSFAASLMAVGKGYLPWSEQPVFRWGFGWGLSYALDIPAIERIKQDNRGDKTNRLLSLLEWQVDVPIDLLFESKLTRGCFFGGSVVHRSGMWGSASILGDVSGGSDYVGFHIECVR